MRKSGIDITGDLLWGSHFALFYRTKEDLIDILVPYFMAGLENNEYCLWVTAEPLGAMEARAKMAAVMPGFDSYEKKGQIEIISFADWYVIDGKFDGTRVLDGWVSRLQQARAKGYEGLRLTGNESWLDSDVWKDFIDYEQTINKVIGQYNMIALCSYAQDKCDASDILDVVSTHQFALNRRDAGWKIIEDQGQKWTRKALRDSEASLAKSQEMAHIGSWELDVATGEIERSAESYRIFGLAPGEYMITFEKFMDFIVPEDRKRVANEYLSSVKSGKPYDVTFGIRRKDGEIRILHSKAEPLKDASGRVVTLFGTNQDITERKQAEEALRGSEEQLRLASQAAGIGVWSWAPGTRRLIVSANWRYLFGIPEGAEITFDTWVSSLHPDDRDRTVRKLHEACEQRREFDTEYRVVRPDGTMRWIVDRGHAWYDEDGRAAGMAGVNVDISERKQSEERLKAATAQAELYLDLMGHDINNINQIALGYLEMARDMQADGNLLEFIDKPMEVLQRSTRLIGNVRKLQKLHEDALPASTIDVCGMLADVQREFGSVPEKAVRLDLNGCRCCRVRANELMHDVFSNLVTNALKHTGERAEILIRLEKLTEDGRQYCRVTVDDNGPGIPDEFKGRIFNRLLKGTEKAKGMGLGLYLVKSLVESYGGRVWVEDRVRGDHAKGAKFVVMLPAFTENETG